MRKILITSIFILSLSTFVLADDVEKGKALFNDSTLGGATKGKSCASCHSEGSAQKWATKKEFLIMGSKSKSLEEAINTCIEKAMGGKKLDPKSPEMKALVAYIKSLKK